MQTCRALKPIYQVLRQVNGVRLTNQPKVWFATAESLPDNQKKSQVPAASDQPAERRPNIYLEKGEKKPSFAREILLGRFDTTLLTFPEVLDKERHETLHEMLAPIEKFFKEQVDSKKLDEEGKIPEKLLNGLKELGLYGQQVPVEYGGLGFNATEYARLQEIISLDGAIAVTLAAHQSIGFKGILLYGTDEQKAKYLPKFASGEWLAAFALTEPGSGSDAGSVSTTARLSKDGKSWVLNGSKCWITNGGTADFFTVFARTADEVVSEKSSKKMTAFLVERSFGGVTNGKPEDKLGIRASNTAEVHFENTVVPLENVLGKVGDGFKIAVNILNNGRFSMGSAVAGGLKQGLELAADYAITRKQFGRPLMDFGLIKEKLGRVALQVYVMESISYVTAGLIDSDEYADCAVEAAIVKVYASDAAFESGSELLQVFGGSGYMKDLPFERALRDSRILKIFEGTNEILRLFISLTCLQHAGSELKTLVKKLRNPFQNPNLIWKKMIEFSRAGSKHPKLTLKLSDYVHPTLGSYASELETCVIRLKFVVQKLLQAHGADIIDPKYQMHLKRLSDIIIDIYAMTCVLSRASRSYCIGLANAEFEIIMAQTFVTEASQRVSTQIEALGIGEPTGALWVDNNIMKIAEIVFKHKGYFAEHPLTKNFW